MAEPIYPSGVSSRGNVKLQFVTTIATLTAPSLATEVNAVSSLDLSCMVAGEGWKPALEQGRVTVKRRICSKNDRENLGVAKYTLPDLLYANNPQGATGTDSVKAAEKLVPGTSGFIIERLGLDAVSTDWAASQKIKVWPVTLGEQLDVYDLTDEADEFMIQQAIVIGGIGKPTKGAIAA